MSLWQKEASSFVLIAFATMAIVLLPVFSSLDDVARFSLVVLIAATVFWIFRPFGISIGSTSCLLLALFLLCGIPEGIVFSGFTKSSVWTMIPALFFGYALKKTGLGRRLVNAILCRIGKPTYVKLIIAWLIIGVVLSLLTPSITVRVIIVMPLAMESVDLCGIPQKSRGRSLVLLSAWFMSVIPGIGWYTGSLLGPVITGIYASVPEIPSVSSSDWISACLLPSATVTVVTLLLASIIIRPEKLSENISVNPFSGLAEEAASREEKITLAVLSSCFCMLATERFHGISSTVICLIGFFLLCLLGVLDEKDISSGISWDMVLFIGASMCFEAVFDYCGVTEWLTDMLYPIVSIFSNHPVALLMLLTVFLFAWRFVDIALLTPTVVIIAAIIPMIEQVCGISHLVWISVFSFAICSFFLPYQNMFLMIGEKECGGDGWLPAHRLTYAGIYCAVAILTVFCMVPFWKFLGYMP